MSDHDILKETIERISKDLAESTRVFYIWKPQKDITAYELAECIPYINQQLFCMPNVSEEAQRHFTRFVYDPKEHNKH